VRGSSQIKNSAPGRRGKFRNFIRYVGLDRLFRRKPEVPRVENGAMLSATVLRRPASAACGLAVVRWNTKVARALALRFLAPRYATAAMDCTDPTL